MTEDEIRALVMAGMPGADVAVGGDGYHIDGVLADVIRSGALHAVNIRARTVAENQATD
jgi:acid stress-induced BolA-like protein IbaG/YrbA